jgi:hypothetical protein
MFITLEPDQPGDLLTTFQFMQGTDCKGPKINPSVTPDQRLAQSSKWKHCEAWPPVLWLW